MKAKQVVVFVIAGAIIITGFILLLTFLLQEDPVANQLEQADEVSKFGTGTDSRQTLVSDKIWSIEEDNSSTDTVDLLDACPNIKAEAKSFTPTCLKALNTLFLNMPLGHTYQDWIKFEDNVTFLQVFDDPMNDRIRVLEALDRPECHLDDGKVIDWELRETCNADSFARYYRFSIACKGSQYGTGSLNYSYWFKEYGGPGTSEFEQHLSLNEEASKDEFGGVDQNSLLNLKQRLWEQVLRGFWVRNMCEAFPTEDILFDAYERDEQFYNILLNIAERTDDYLLPDGRGHNVRKLLFSMAARYGHPWASRNYSASRYDTEYLDFKIRKYPWLDLLDDALGHNPLDLSRGIDADPADELKARLIAAAELVKYFENEGTKFDLHLLIDELCSSRNVGGLVGDGASCRSTMAALNQSNTLEIETLRILDRFEQVAIELDLYE